MIRNLILILALLFASTSRADVVDAVVKVGGCSGVCVDQCGLVLTARHCDLPETVQVEFPGQTVTAVRVYLCNETEGVVAFDCEGDGYPFVPVAPLKPERRDVVTLYGYAGPSRSLVQHSGPVLGGSNGMSFLGRPVAPMNVVRAVAIPGMSGGPAVNSRGEVVGLVSCGDAFTTCCLSWSSIQEAVNSADVPDSGDVPELETGKLYIFTGENCSHCVRFKADYDGDAAFHDALGDVEFVNTSTPEGAAIADRHNVTIVPTFIRGDVRVRGYQNKDSLLDGLGIEAGEANATEVPAAVDDAIGSDVTPPAPVTSARPVDDAAADGRAGGIGSLLRTLASAAIAAAPLFPPAAGAGAGLGAAWLVVRGVGGIIRRRRAAHVATQSGVTAAADGTRPIGPHKPTEAGSIPAPAIDSVCRYPPPRIYRPDECEPVVISSDCQPPPQRVVTETKFQPYERDTFSEAFAYAESQLAQKYPGSVGTVEFIRSMIDQYMSSKGVKNGEK